MQCISTARSAGWSSLISAFALAATASAQSAQPASPAAEPDAPVRLDTLVVSASRTAQDPATASSAVVALQLPDLAAAQIADLRTALAQTPGLAIASSGPTGAQTSVFLRGASSHQTLFVVDGVRMNDRAAAYFNFLGGADLVGVDRVEVLRGPQSTLYGSSAMGGVILLETAHGCGPATGAASVSGGSFSTLGAAIAEAGGTERLGYSASLAFAKTGNDQPRNNYNQWSYSTRVEGTPAAVEGLLLGATFRGQQGDYEETGSRLYPSAADVAADNHLATAYAQWSSGKDFSSRLTAGLHQRRYTYASAWGTSEMRNRREIVDWQNTWRPADGIEVVGGTNYEKSRYTIDGGRTNDRVTAGYLSARWRPVEAVNLTAGVRADDFRTFGSATTGRLGAAWRATATTKLRATYGTGFTAPGTDDRYGVPQWGQLANPDLAPEKSRGWDFGIDQELAGGRVTVAATWFQNRFRNLFEYEIVDWTTYAGKIVNRARASTEGLELAATARVTGGVQARLSYTYLEAENDVTDARLIRRPRHVLDAEVRAQPAAAWTVGAGVHVAADRVDSSGPIGDYTTVRVFAGYAATQDVTVKVRVENALNERYEEVLGYAALPRGVFGSVEWKF